MRQYWIAPIPPFHTADGAAYATSITLAEVSPTPPVVLPANVLEIGSRLEFSAFGRFSNTGTPTLTLGIYIGTGVIATGQAAIVSAAITTITAAANRTWRLEGNASVRTVGSATAATIIGALEISNLSTNGTDLAPATAPATFAFDSTIANNVRLGATWGTSSASNTLTCHYFGVRLVN